LLTVTATDTLSPGITGNNSLTVVSDAPIMASSRTIRIQRGPVTVATFTYAGAGTPSATIDWGDGSGALPAQINGGNVTGTHAYSHKGTFVVTVQISSTAGSKAIVTDTASFLPRTFSF
jgi:hypothetical protein